MEQTIIIIQEEEIQEGRMQRMVRKDYAWIGTRKESVHIQIVGIHMNVVVVGRINTDMYIVRKQMQRIELFCSGLFNIN